MCNIMSMIRKDLTGKRFGLITVLSYSRRVVRKSGTYIHYWKCKDDFGFESEISSSNLCSGRVKSCGHYLSTRKRQNHPRWNGCGEVSAAMFYSIESGAKARKIEFKITIEQIWDLFLKQESRCALSGIELKFASNDRKRDGTASLDRIDSSKSYIIENVQWVHKDINKMKQNLNEEDFIKYCKAIADYKL